MWSTLVRLVIGLCLGLLAINLPRELQRPSAATTTDDTPAIKTDPEPVVVPFSMLPSNHMVVEAKLNGKGPFRFIFDLGAPVTLVNSLAAEQSGAIDKNAPRSFMMGLRGEGNIESLELGDLKAGNVPVIVMDHPVLKALSGFFSRPLVGIIGYTFWARYKMTIDYQARQMTFVPIANFEVRDLMKELPDRLSSPKKSQNIVLAPRGVWGLTVADPQDGLSSRGVPITSVVAGSPAAAAGIKPGDLLIAIDGRWTTTIADAFSAIQHVPAGQPTPVVIQHDGTQVHLSVTPVEGL